MRRIGGNDGGYCVAASLLRTELQKFDVPFGKLRGKVPGNAAAKWWRKQPGT